MYSRSYSTDPALDALGRWITSQEGGFFHEAIELTPADSKNNNGSTVAAVKTLPKETRFINCPYSCTIDYAKVQSHYPQSFLAEVTPHAALCFFLCYQYLQGEKSFWWPYLNVLPQKFDTPLYFSSEDKVFLEGCNLNEKEIEGRREAWEKEWKDGIRAMKTQGYDIDDYSWSLFLWASTVFSSRCFSDKLMRSEDRSPSEDESLPALFPLIDMLNHRPMTRITWQPSLNALCLISGDSCEAGSEIFNNYGAKPNEELLMGYGFAIPSNPTDTVTLRFAPVLSPNQEAIRQHQLQPEIPGLYRLSSNEYPIFPKSLTSLFNILVALPREGAYLLKEPATERVSIRNVLATYTQLYLAMRRKLSGFTTDPGEPQNARQAAAKIYREGQMDILRAAIKESQDVLTDTYNLYLGSEISSLQLALENAQFADAIEKCFGTADYRELVEAQQDDIVGVLHLCWKYLTSSDEKWRRYFECVGQDYQFQEDVTEDEADEEAEEVFNDIFPEAAEAAPEVFGQQGWTPQLLKWGMSVYQDEGVTVVINGSQFVVLCIEVI